MAIAIGAVLGMIIWIVGFALFPSPHANFDWFMPLPVILLIAYAIERVGPYIRNMLRP